MVKLWKPVGYRVKIPNLTNKTFYEFQSGIYNLTPNSFVEQLRLSNRVAVIVPNGVGSALEELFDTKGYSWLRADIHLTTKIKR